MPVATEENTVGRRIQMTREPVGPKNAGSKGSPGDQALMDAVAIVLAAWVILFLFGFSLRHHNI
jgi:hypothetical protein